MKIITSNPRFGSLSFNLPQPKTPYLISLRTKRVSRKINTELPRELGDIYYKAKLIVPADSLVKALEEMAIKGCHQRDPALQIQDFKSVNAILRTIIDQQKELAPLHKSLYYQAVSMGAEVFNTASTTNDFIVRWRNPLY